MRMRSHRRALKSIEAVKMDQADWSKRVDVALGGGSGVSHKVYEKSAGLARARGEGKRLGRPPIAPALEKRIREALATPGRPGVRVIAKQFGVNPGTVQRISRPFEQDAVAL